MWIDALFSISLRTLETNVASSRKSMVTRCLFGLKSTNSTERRLRGHATTAPAKRGFRYNFSHSRYKSLGHARTPCQIVAINFILLEFEKGKRHATF